MLRLARQDDNIVLILSNIYTVDKAEDFQQKAKKRPVKTSSNRRIVRRVYRSDYMKELQILYFIDDNHYIGGIDLTNQFREAYETHKPTFKT